ncbi:major facilitator superfamily domain-containing protein [Clohesyomyces aquaticus]|uniref:Major facilitator superfamily domain-containing protein n=1 Tax=Clohesyomyces aquaticus TaxID=1231657 RepID=A0A1Y1ZF78_9PLEO|nr:major facilitator superfamily domain-containing protein [Clohesyomyces aquaticus]
MEIDAVIDTESNSTISKNRDNADENGKFHLHSTVAESSSSLGQDQQPNQEVKQNSLWRRIVGMVWDSLDGDPEYRRYVQRLDRIFFPTVLLGYFIKYLDQTNYILGTWFSLGVMVGSIPAQMSQLRWVRPSILLPSCELIWSSLRFFIGLFEACAFPGHIALLGSWYGPKELTKRLAILLQVESIARIFSGYLGCWRWLFIMDAIISIPIANTRAFYLSNNHIKYGIERIEKLGQREQTKLTRKDLKRVYPGWEIWVFVVPYTMVAAWHTATSYFSLWLKWAGYSVVQTNYLPTGGSALNIVFSFICGVIADATGQNYWMTVAIQGLVILCNVLLSVWTVPKVLLLFAYYVSYAGSAATPILISWATQLTTADASLRQLLVATANVVSYAWVLWVPLVVFPTYDAPKYKYGYQILILFGGLAVVSVTLMKYMYWRKG